MAGGCGCGCRCGGGAQHGQEVSTRTQDKTPTQANTTPARDDRTVEERLTAIEDLLKRLTARTQHSPMQSHGML